MSNDRIHFLPPSNAAKVRQKAWNFLQKTTEATLLKELALAIGEEYRDTYAAAKHLVRKGLAERINQMVEIAIPSKKNPDQKKTKAMIALKGVPPWSAKKKCYW